MGNLPPPSVEQRLNSNSPFNLSQLCHGLELLEISKIPHSIYLQMLHPHCMWHCHFYMFVSGRHSEMEKYLKLILQ